MALRDELVEVPFTGGLDLKTDEKLVIPGKLLELENAVFTKRGHLRKRWGYQALSRDVQGGAALTAGEALAVYDPAAAGGQSELLLCNGRTAYGYSEGLARWINKGRVVPCTVANREILRNSAEQTDVDAASLAGLTMFAWKDSRGGVRCSVVDDASAAVLLSDAVVAAGGTNPRVIGMGASLHVIYAADSDTDVRLRRVTVTDPLTLVTETTLSNDLVAASPHIDVSPHGTKAVLAWFSTAGGIELAYLLPDGTVGGTLDGVPDPIVVKHPTDTFETGDVDAGDDEIALSGTLPSVNTVVRFTTTGTLPAGLSLATDYFVVVSAAGVIKVSATLGGAAVDITDAGSGTHTIAPQEDADNCLAVTVDQDSQQIYLVWHSDLNGLRAAVLNDDFTYAVLPLSIEAVASPAALNVTAVVTGAGGSAQVFWEVDAAADTNHLLKSATLSAAGAVGSPSVFARGLGLAGKAFLQSDLAHVLAVQGSAAQGAYFVLDGDGNVVARMLPLAGGGLRTGLSTVIADSATRFRVALLKKTRFVTEATSSGETTTIAAFSLRGVAEGTLDFAGANRYLGAQLGRNLHITGGYLAAYDGHGFVEHGFFQYPEGLLATPSASGGSMADGTYSYVAVYAWTDNAGQVHRSAPSLPVTMTISGGGGSGKGTITVPTLRVTQKRSPRTNVIVEIYRTAASGEVFQLATSSTSPLYNDPTADTVSFEDTLADAGLLARPFLYTTGGILPNDCPPAPALIWASKNRVFLVSQEDPHRVWPSKGHVTGEGIAFSEALKLSVDPDGGPITGLAEMDGKVIVFKRRRIAGFAGEGPDETGNGTPFSQPKDIAVDVGCDEPRTIVLGPNGLMFKSEKGIYTLTRSLAVEYTGAEVEAHNGLQNTSAVMLADANEIRFTTATGPTLLHDYEHKQWGTFTRQDAVAAVLWGSRYVWLKADGRAWVETPETYRDGEVRYAVKITMAWLHAAGLQGYQRVKRAYVIGKALGDHILFVRAGFDYDGSYPETFSFDSREITSGAYFGSSEYFGADSFFGGAEDLLYQWEMRIAHQKCQAIRFSLNDLPVNADDEGFELAGLALLVGFKKGAAKLREGKRA